MTNEQRGEIRSHQCKLRKLRKTVEIQQSDIAQLETDNGVLKEHAQEMRRIAKEEIDKVTKNTSRFVQEAQHEKQKIELVQEAQHEDERNYK